MKYKLIQDNKLRQKFKNREIIRNISKAFSYNLYLNNSMRDFSKEILKKEKGLGIKIKNRCIITGRSHGIMRDFKLSRIQFKEMVVQGLIVGIKKGSW